MVIVNRKFQGLSFGVTLFAVLTAGCAITEPTRVEADFGNSVKQMVQAQTYNPEAAASTESKPVEQMDGQIAIGVLEQMRTDVNRVEQFQNQINISIGDEGN